MKKYVAPLFLAVLMISMLFLCSFSSQRNAEKKVGVTRIEFVSGSNEFIPYTAIEKLLIQKPVAGVYQTKSMINLQRLEQSVLQNPYVEKATVFLTLEGVLKAHVKQREPVVRLQTKEGSYYLDKQGVRVPLSKLYTPRVLLLTGANEAEDVAEIMPLILAILSDDFLKKEVVGVHKSADNTFQLSVRSGTYKIAFGSLKNKENKFKKIKAFYNTTFLDKTIQQYQTINVTYRNQVVCTK